MGQWLRSLRDLTQHLTTRADDSHAAPVHRPAEPTPAFQRGTTSKSSLGEVLRVASN